MDADFPIWKWGATITNAQTQRSDFEIGSQVHAGTIL